METAESIQSYARTAHDEMGRLLKGGILEFWLNKGIDRESGGYRTCFDGQGRPWALTDKFIVTQARMIWGLSLFSRVYPDDGRIEPALRQGVGFFLRNFWDGANGGWFWSVERDGGLLDGGKVVYGQSFAIYALAQYALSTGDRTGQQYAEQTFDLLHAEFRSIPAINIRRTWNAERPAGDTLMQPLDTTSYGHNVELLWLINRAAETMSLPKDSFDGRTKGLADHALRYGIDYELGGIFRDGPHAGEPLVKDKEWWQNCESLVGFLDAYLHFGDKKYFEAFRLIWEFDKKHMIRPEHGEFMQLVKKNGDPICADLGNPWKAIYHSGRSMYESMLRLKTIGG